MAGKNLRIVFGKLSKPINHQSYYSAFLKEGTNDEIDEKTLTTHDFIGDASDYAGKRQLSCISRGDQAVVYEVEGKVE